ncbi:UbiD family decarboxylase domain-containing protein [Actinoallomurus iriomotensis]|uniref:3-octaprenyl-4-hydroxybenzoate carboxy-lyase-like Rift-related domain-containing protein n=1 Tax=Actinoallomurus iriomotensis TaxID=478107 RepID=A0A9W6VQ70_9ACTN|nr:UbiD family decarboxylase domain-containing protein [Actinoallomurus iriomotensis]GLY80768.1 hypothetical protein Airi01_090350 [Actinoallomurus iriomotensis]
MTAEGADAPPITDLRSALPTSSARWTTSWQTTWDGISVFFAPGRHIDEFRRRAEAADRPFPISVNMGVDPAIHIGATSEAPTTPLGYDEPAIAGGLRGTPVRQPALPARGTSAKMIFDATVPFRFAAAFERARLDDVDPRPYAPGLDLPYP